MKNAIILALAIAFGSSGINIANANAGEKQTQTVKKSGNKLKPAQVKATKPEKKKLEKKPDGSFGYRYTCSPSGFGQMGKCW